MHRISIVVMMATLAGCSASTGSAAPDSGAAGEDGEGGDGGASPDADASPFAGADGEAPQGEGGAPASDASSLPDAPDTTPGALKADVSGLLDRGNNPNAPVGGSNFTKVPSAWQAVVSAFVVNATWADLQAVQGGPIAAGNAIDQAIAFAAPAHLQIKIRIAAGEFAPAWVKSLDGGPLPTTSGLGIGRWWMPDYEAAYADLVAKLAALYDGVPEVRNVTIAGCMTLYAEPLLKDDVDPTVMIQAGYTNALDQQCQHSAIQAHAAWHETHQSFSFNPYANVNPATPAVDEAFTESLMDFCATTLGKRCALENNSIRYPNNPGAYGAMYAHMGSLQASAGVPVDFQTATLVKLNTAPEQGLAAVLSWATGGFSSPVHASSVELPSGYMTDGTLSSPAAYQTYAAALLADPH